MGGSGASKGERRGSREERKEERKERREERGKERNGGNGKTKPLIPGASDLLKDLWSEIDTPGQYRIKQNETKIKTKTIC